MRNPMGQSDAIDSGRLLSIHPGDGRCGAGFKAFRPVLYDKTTKEYSFKENDRLKSKRNLYPWSRVQYKGSMDDFTM